MVEKEKGNKGAKKSKVGETLQERRKKRRIKEIFEKNGKAYLGLETKIKEKISQVDTVIERKEFKEFESPLTVLKRWQSENKKSYFVQSLQYPSKKSKEVKTEKKKKRASLKKSSPRRKKYDKNIEKEIIVPKKKPPVPKFEFLRRNHELSKKKKKKETAEKKKQEEDIITKRKKQEEDIITKRKKLNQARRAVKEKKKKKKLKKRKKIVEPVVVADEEEALEEKSNIEKKEEAGKLKETEVLNSEIKKKKLKRRKKKKKVVQPPVEKKEEKVLEEKTEETEQLEEAEVLDSEIKEEKVEEIEEIPKIEEAGKGEENYDDDAEEPVELKIEKEMYVQLEPEVKNIIPEEKIEKQVKKEEELIDVGEIDKNEEIEIFSDDIRCLESDPKLVTYSNRIIFEKPGQDIGDNVKNLKPLAKQSDGTDGDLHADLYDFLVPMVDDIECALDREIVTKEE